MKKVIQHLMDEMEYVNAELEWMIESPTADPRWGYSEESSKKFAKDIAKQTVFHRDYLDQLEAALNILEAHNKGE